MLASGADLIERISQLEALLAEVAKS